MAKKVTKQGYLDAVAQKLSDPKINSMLRYGPMGADFGGTPLRDDVGLQVTFSNILQLAENLFDRQGGDLLAGAIQTNFSQIGFGDVANVRTVGAVDVDIILQSNSLVPFLSIDRAMPNPIDTIYYSDLVTVDSYNGISAGGTVVGNFQAPINISTSLKFYNEASTVAEITSVSSTYTSEQIQKIGVVPGSVVVKAISQNKATYQIARDIPNNTGDGTGSLYWGPVKSTIDNSIVVGGDQILTGGTVNYNTGAVSSIATTNTPSLVTVSAMKNSWEETTGDGILKVRPDYKAVQLTTKPKQIIFQDNEATSVYMNRILAQASKVSGLTNYTTIQFGRIANLYTEDVNRDLIRNLIMMSNGVESFELNIGDYIINSSFAETKNDKVSQLVLDVSSDLMRRTGLAPTVIVVGTKVASVLMNIPIKFVPSAAASTTLNSFIGTFLGIPVYRHNYIDQTIDATIDGDNLGNFYMGVKLPDNSAGSLAYGEYIPLSKTAEALNFNNPIQNSTAWFSQIGIKQIYPTLVGHGVLNFTASSAGGTSATTMDVNVKTMPNQNVSILGTVNTQQAGG